MTDTTAKFKRGIIQSRGLGDIIIALPIARWYYEQGEEIVWPICEEFYSSVELHVPWVTWIPIPADPKGFFFYNRPVEEFKRLGIPESNWVYLYQYLNSHPELTDPEQFNILKFDQYKYQTAGVAFRDKWRLSESITRQPKGEDQLRERLTRAGVDLSRPYAVAHLTGSSARVDMGIVNSIVDPAVQKINVDDYLTASIFDWWGVVEGAEALICLDSAMANMVDQLCITGPRLYWIRRSAWDLTPVLGSSWRFVKTNLPITEPTRVDPAVEAARKQPQPTGGLVSHVPFEADRSKYPTSFMHALKR